MSVLCRRICAAYFPLCFSLLLTFSLFPLFNRLLSPLDSVIVILKQPLPSPAFCLCLSQFPSLLISTQQRCFLGEHLLFSLVFSLPLPPTLSRSYSVFFMILERICLCSFALCSRKPIFLPPRLLSFLETIVTKDQNSFPKTIKASV